jgi:hypothetical protein
LWNLKRSERVDQRLRALCKTSSRGAGVEGHLADLVMRPSYRPPVERAGRRRLVFVATQSL